MQHIIQHATHVIQHATCGHTSDRGAADCVQRCHVGRPRSQVARGLRVLRVLIGNGKRRSQTTASSCAHLRSTIRRPYSIISAIIHPAFGSGAAAVPCRRGTRKSPRTERRGTASARARATALPKARSRQRWGGPAHPSDAHRTRKQNSIALLDWASRCRAPRRSLGTRIDCRRVASFGCS